jgi:hypothetical protein
MASLIKILDNAKFLSKTVFETESSPSYDSTAAAYIAAVEAADGQALENSIKIAYNDFIVGCKSDGIWNALKASCILAGARTLNGALVPLVGTAPINFNFVSADYNRETGLKGDASTKYLDPKRRNNEDPQDSKHIAVYQTESESKSGTTVRTAIANPFATGQSFLGTTSTQAPFGINSSNFNTTHSQSTLGLFGASRLSSSVMIQRLNGSSTSRSINSTTPSSSGLGVFSRGIPGGQRSDARISFYSIGENLNLALLDTRVSALMTAINAAI